MSDLTLRSVLPVFTLVAGLHAGLAYALAYGFTPDRDPRPLPAVQISLVARPAAPVVAARPPVQRPAPRPMTKDPAPAPVAPAEPTQPQVQSEPEPPAPAPTPPAAVAEAPVESEAPIESWVEPIYRMTSLNNPPPGYPAAARRRGQEGTVVVSAEVLTTGTCGSVVMKRSSGHALLDQAALDAVKKWRFLPARRGREPVVAWVEVPITFRLDQYAHR